MPTASKNLTFGALMLIVVFGLSSLALYGGAKLVEVEKPASQATNGAPTGGPVTATIVAKALKFEPRSLVASPGVRVTVNLDNQDAGVLHNISFFNNRNYTGPIVVGEIFAGPAIKTVSFTAPDSAGNYPFRCDVHPDTMTGVLSVK